MPGRHCRSRIDAYLEGALDERSRRRLARHLQHCPECRDHALQRRRVLEAARSVSGRPAAHPAALPTAGTPGRLVVALLALAVLVGAALTALWLAGAPRPSEAAPRDADPRQALGIVADAGATGEDTTGPDEMIARLRRAGWAVPSLVPSGMRPLDVSVSERGEDAGAVVAVDWGRAEPVVTIRECRAAGVGRACEDAADPDGARSGEPTEATGESTSTADAAATDEETAGRLPVGVDYELEDRAEGGWRARLTTGQAAYEVESTLPRGQAEALLTQLVVAERSGLEELTDGRDTVVDRFGRGIDRLRGSGADGTDSTAPAVGRG